MKVKLLVEEVSNADDGPKNTTFLRLLVENFKRIREAFLSQKILNASFQFFEITIPAAVTNYRYPHALGFQPKDVIQTSLTGGGSLTWNYALFTAEFLDITTTGACVVRAYIGAHKEE